MLTAIAKKATNPAYPLSERQPLFKVASISEPFVGRKLKTVAIFFYPKAVVGEIARRQSARPDGSSGRRFRRDFAGSDQQLIECIVRNIVTIDNREQRHLLIGDAHLFEVA